MYYENIVDAVGNTPMIKLRNIARGIKATVLVKAENLNPCGSVKDRIGITMIDAAEADGSLKPGGTIVEGSSGNTGLGLAMVACVRGYKVIITIPDKMSHEKINLMRAFGVEVVVCPTAVAPDDPRSYYEVAKRLHREIPNSIYPNQYFNDANPLAHYQSTGPEVWNDTDGKITHFVVGIGTGGTASGAGKYLKEQNPNVKVIGVDPIGSLYHKYFHSDVLEEADRSTYLVEGIGEDMLPSTMHFDVLDDVRQVNDRECFVAARRLCRSEGIFAGGSAGGAVHAGLEVARECGPDDVVVILLPDSGGRYLSKVFNDEWMREHQMLEVVVKITAGEIIAKKDDSADMVWVAPETPLLEAVQKMRDNDVSQLPVMRGSEVLGRLGEDVVVEVLMRNPAPDKMIVDEVMGDPIPVVSRDAGLDTVSLLFTKENNAVLVDMGNGNYEIITKYDLLHSVTRA
jgi:cystathionine beta-synthase